MSWPSLINVEGNIILSWISLLLLFLVDYSCTTSSSNYFSGSEDDVPGKKRQVNEENINKMLDFIFTTTSDDKQQVWTSPMPPKSTCSCHLSQIKMTDGVYETHMQVNQGGVDIFYSNYILMIHGAMEASMFRKQCVYVV